MKGFCSCHIFVVFMLAIVFTLPMWVALPALNEFIIARTCQAMHGLWNTTGPICGADDVSKSAQLWQTVTMLACNLPSLFVSLPLGRISDVQGRRPVLLWMLATQIVGSAGMLAVCLWNLPLYWLIPTYIINGFGGGSYIFQNVLMSSLVDVSQTKRHRDVLLSFMTGMYYFCGTVGPLIGGYLSANEMILLFPTLHGRQYQFAHVLFFASNVLVLLLGIIFFRETKKTETVEKENHSSQKASLCKIFCEIWSGAGKAIKRKSIGIMSVVICLMYISM